MPELPLFTVASAIGNCGPSTSASSDSVYVDRWIVRPRWGKLPLATNPHRRVHHYQPITFAPEKRAFSFCEKKDLLYSAKIFSTPRGLLGSRATNPAQRQDQNQAVPNETSLSDRRHWDWVGLGGLFRNPISMSRSRKSTLAALLSDGSLIAAA